MYFSCCREERERRGGKTVPVPSYRSLDDDNEYCPTEGNEESDVSTSDSSEDWNDEFVDGWRSKEQLSQPSDRGYQSEYDNSDEDVLIPLDSNNDVGNIRTVGRGKRYEPGCPIEAIKFDVGMKFESAVEFTTRVGRSRSRSSFWHTIRSNSQSGSRSRSRSDLSPPLW